MQTSRLIWIATLVLLLSACGFQLRGTSKPLDKILPALQLVTSGKDPAFDQALRGVLKDARIQLNDSSVNKLEILGTGYRKRTASYSSRAKSAEYELIKTINIRFSREDRELIAPMKLEARRSYLYRETVAVGKAEEEILLRDEMDQDLAQRILLALQHAVHKPQEPVRETAPQPDP